MHSCLGTLRALQKDVADRRSSVIDIDLADLDAFLVSTFSGPYQTSRNTLLGHEHAAFLQFLCGSAHPDLPVEEKSGRDRTSLLRPFQSKTLGRESFLAAVQKQGLVFSLPLCSAGTCRELARMRSCRF